MNPAEKEPVKKGRYAFSKWQDIKFRLENTALRDIMFGSFTAITSAFFYRYTTLNGTSQSAAALIDSDMLLASAMALVFAASFRYLGHFAFVFSCPTLIQSHKDIDDLLKKAKDSLTDTEEWANVHRSQAVKWGADNYRRPILRLLIWFTEMISFGFFAAGICLLFLAVHRFLLQMLRLF
ncbi:hypothetical protein [Methylobacterium sp. R2-1]|uniref:hypothetical protein n=1 Tax=Methylobacterium sp. R2-1 TaxID=2587064 RepID=UPI001613251B|nr:hypothetical protein [Methylobacterium sp. R2-1]MBB2964269.1 hypothetical protein [Methylobacterium sp. R2-1]